MNSLAKVSRYFIFTHDRCPLPVHQTHSSRPKLLFYLVLPIAQLSFNGRSIFRSSLFFKKQHVIFQSLYKVENFDAIFHSVAFERHAMAKRPFSQYSNDLPVSLNDALNDLRDNADDIISFLQDLKREKHDASRETQQHLSRLRTRLAPSFKVFAEAGIKTPTPSENQLRVSEPSKSLSIHQD